MSRRLLRSASTARRYGCSVTKLRYAVGDRMAGRDPTAVPLTEADSICAHLSAARNTG